MFQVIERYNGKTTVLDETDDEADALRTRDWHRDQWSCQTAARQSVYVQPKGAR